MPETPTLEDLIAEEKQIVIDRFDYGVAWEIGSHIQAEARRRNLPIAIEIAHGASPVFLAILPGATPDNSDWTRRKRAVAWRFHKSSLFMRLQAEARGWDFNQRFRLSATEFIASGGAVPIVVRNAGVVGTAAVSGLPDVEDHAMVVAALRAQVLPEVES